MKTSFLKPAIAFLFILVTFSCSKDEDTVEMPNEISVADEILRLVNAHRQTQNLSVLQKNETAQKLAIDHSRYMISLGDINHDNFDLKFKTLKEQENARGMGENVAFGQQSAKDVMNSWLNSSGHRDNIEGNYTHIGIGAVKDENGRFYYTQVFFR